MLDTFVNVDLTDPWFVFIISYRRTALDGLGKSMELTKYTERLVPSTRFVAVNGIAPKVSEMSFVAPSASVIGDVTIGKESRCEFFNVELLEISTIGDFRTEGVALA